MIKKEEKYLIFAAESTHLVIQLEKIFLERDIQCRIIPLPTEISANCGLSVRTETDVLDRALEIIKEANMQVTVSLIEKKGFKKNIEKII